MFGQAGGKELISLEIVLGNGDIVRTGFAALPEPDWSVPSPHAIYPDLTGIFVHSLGTLGIITKASVRIYYRNEEQAMPVGAFDTLKDAYETVKKLERAYLIESGPIFHWRDVEFFGIHVNNPMEKIDEKLDQLLESPDIPPFEKRGEMPYCFVPLIISGYKGEIENRVKFISKFVDKHHGKILSEDELRRYLGDGYYETWQLGFMDHTPMDQIIRMKAQRFQVNSTAFVGPPRKCVEAEPEILRKIWDLEQEFKKKGLKLQSAGYYFHPADQARTCYFRAGIFTTGSRKEVEKILHELNDLAIKKYSLHPAPATWRNYYVDKVLASYYNLYKHLKEYCDPNNIMNTGMDMLSKPSEVVKF